MNKKYDGWTDFIIKNWKPGTATEIANHIEKEADKQGFMSNNNKKALVFKFLPESAPNSPRRSKTRKVVRNILWWDKDTKWYHMSGDLILSNTLTLDNKKEVKTRNDNGKKISIESPKDKSIKHDDLVKLITEYARKQNYIVNPEKDNIDILIKKDKKYQINEVKTYANSIYVAVGQVQYYKYKLLKKYKNIDESKISHLNIIGDFILPHKFEDFLKSIKIRYININDLEKYFI